MEIKDITEFRSSLANMSVEELKDMLKDLNFSLMVENSQTHTLS